MVHVKFTCFCNVCVHASPVPQNTAYNDLPLLIMLHTWVCSHFQCAGSSSEAYSSTAIKQAMKEQQQVMVSLHTHR